MKRFICILIGATCIFFIAVAGTNYFLGEADWLYQAYKWILPFGSGVIVGYINAHMPKKEDEKEKNTNK